MYNQNTTALMEQETFVLPAMAESEFSSAELAEDMDGLQMSFQRVKIPAGGTIQFELPPTIPKIRTTQKHWSASFFTTTPPAPIGRREASTMKIPPPFVLLWTVSRGSEIREAPARPVP